MKKFVTKNAAFVLILSVSLLGVFTACQSKTEEPAKEETKTEAQMPEQTKPDTMQAEAPKPVVSLAGTWQGMFDSRETTLTITSSDSTSIKGKITINYRTVINQEVEGTFNPETKEFSMKDLLHSRYQGKYAGKLSENFDKMEGTFTMDVDGKKLSFNLTKK